MEYTATTTTIWMKLPNFFTTFFVCPKAITEVSNKGTFLNYLIFLYNILQNAQDSSIVK